MSNYALMVEFHPAFHMRVGTPNLIRTLCSDPDHPFKAVVATDHRGPNPIAGPWDSIPTLSLFRPRSLFPNLRIGLGLLDKYFFRWQRKRVIRFLEKHNIDRLFVVIANNARFSVFITELLDVFSNRGRAADVYIIDDFVADSHIYRVSRQEAQQAMDKLVKTCDRIFSISPVYAQDIQKEYGRQCGVLPIPIPRDNFAGEKQEHAVQQAQIKSDIDAPITLHHAGQLHHLYADAAAQLVPVLKTIADTRNAKITLELWGNLNADQVEKALNVNLRDYSDNAFFNIKLCGETTMDHLLEIQKQSDFLMLFNSFIPRLTKQIRCSLSSKLLEYLLSGVPILLYGPPYSSLVEHLGKHDAAHIVATDDAGVVQQQLEKILFDPDRNRTADAAYKLAQNQHSTKVLYERVKNL